MAISKASIALIMSDADRPRRGPAWVSIGAYFSASISTGQGGPTCWSIGQIDGFWLKSNRGATTERKPAEDRDLDDLDHPCAGPAYTRALGRHVLHLQRLTVCQSSASSFAASAIYACRQRPIEQRKAASLSSACN